MSGSGNKRLLLNPRERVTSGDHNRLQAFLGRDIAEVLRWLTDAAAPFDEVSGGYVSSPTLTLTPLRGVVIAGLMAQPEDGTNLMWVSEGVLCAMNPDAAPDADDSAYKWIVDPGTSVALTMTVGAGSTRVDVLECSRTNTLLETASRDVFNASTGLFSAQTVEKARADRLTYRIRTGTPGGGYPGNAAGWMPLAVLVVPAAATTWDTCTIWDVRPLLADLIHPPMKLDRTLPLPRRFLGNGVKAPLLLRGVCESTYRERVAGGLLPNAGIDVTTISTAYHETGYAHADGGFHLWALFPHSLPRWCRYNTLAEGSPRAPYGFRGIPVISRKGPANVTGSSPSSAITLPAGTGLTGTTTVGAHVWAGNGLAAGPASYVADGKAILFPAADVPILSPSSSDNNTATYALVDNTHYPANARALYLRMSVVLTSTGAGIMSVAASVETRDPGNTVSLYATRAPNQFVNFTAGAQAYTLAGTFRVPLVHQYPYNHGAAPFTRRFLFQYAAAAFATAGSHSCQVVGWELAD